MLSPEGEAELWLVAGSAIWLRLVMVSMPPISAHTPPSSGAVSKHLTGLGHEGGDKGSLHNKFAIVQRILEDADLGSGDTWDPNGQTLKPLLWLRLGNWSHLFALSSVAWLTFFLVKHSARRNALGNLTLSVLSYLRKFNLNKDMEGFPAPKLPSRGVRFPTQQGSGEQWVEKHSSKEPKRDWKTLSKRPCGCSPFLGSVLGLRSLGSVCLGVKATPHLQPPRAQNRARSFLARWEKF